MCYNECMSYILLNYLRLHPEKDKTGKRQRAIRLRGGNGITKTQWEDMCRENDWRCSYCGRVMPLVTDHVVPLCNGGENDISNIVPACVSCNCKKGRKSLLMFLYKQSRL